MATYKFGHYEMADGYEYLAISRKTLFGWKKEKTWELGYEFFGDFTQEDLKRQNQKMMESVNRLIKAGHTVI